MAEAPESRNFTYHTRLSIQDVSEVDVVLKKYAELYGQVERKLCAALMAQMVQSSMKFNSKTAKNKIKKPSQTKVKVVSTDPNSVVPVIDSVIDSVIDPAVARQAQKDTQNAIKTNFLKRFELTSRQYNAVLFGLRGKLDSVKELAKDHLDEAEARIKSLKKTITKLAKRLDELKDPAKALKAGKTVKTMTVGERQAEINALKERLHQKKRKLATREDRVVVQQQAAKKDVRSICFGSRKLFRKQCALAENGYVDAAAWKATKPNSVERAELKKAGRAVWLKDWQASRSTQFFVMGSGDETAGNQSCVATEMEDGSLSLRLRLPEALIQAGEPKQLTLAGLRFPYGQDEIVKAVKDSKSVKVMTPGGGRQKRVGTALSYRFVRDDKGWRVFVSLSQKPPQGTTSLSAGAVGVDINADHLAVTEVDDRGNWCESFRIETHSYGATPDQLKAILGDAAQRIARFAQSKGKPVIREDLDFKKKKTEQDGRNAKRSRMLSSFHYSSGIKMLVAACFKAGVEVRAVNPAYTSVIGAVNFAQRLGISTHQGAALAIARRGLGFSEKPTGQKVLEGNQNGVNEKGSSNEASKKTGNSGLKAAIPCSDGGHVTLVLPARNRTKHVWTQWSKIRQTIQAAYVTRSLSGIRADGSARKGKPEPLRPVKQKQPASSTNGEKSAEFRLANQENCLPDGLDDSEDMPF